MDDKLSYSFFLKYLKTNNQTLQLTIHVYVFISNYTQARLGAWMQNEFFEFKV